MNARQSEGVIWTPAKDHVSFSCGDLSGQLNTEAGSGLSSILCGDQLIPGVLWRVNANADASSPLPAPSEVYQRGADSVSMHSISAAFPYQTQLRWSVQQVADGSAVMITLTASLQTDLLDTSPRLGLVSSLPIDPKEEREGMPEGEGRWIYSSQESSAWRCLEVVHPLDKSEFEERQEADRSLLQLSPPFLEKGVIRRCRVAAIFLSPQAKEESLQSTYDEFVNAELPLTN